MEPSSPKNVSNNIRITLPPPTTLQNNNNSILSRFDDSPNNLPVISSISSASNNNNSMFSSLLPKQSSPALNNNNINNRVELPSIESLGHNSHNNLIFPQRHYPFTAATNSNNLIDTLTSNRMSVSAILSNNNSSNSNGQFPITSSSSSSSILLHPPLTRLSPVSIPSLSSLTQFLDERRRNVDLELHNNNTNNIKDIDNSSFYHYNNRNNCHQNDDNNEVVEDDEVMEKTIINDNNEIDDESTTTTTTTTIATTNGNNHNNKIKKIKNKHKKIVKKERNHHLGQLVYSPKEILPPLEFNVNSLLEVWIPAKHLSWENLKVRKRFLWGTDIYTDDSDIVAVLIHTGNYIPNQYNFKSIPDYPDYDLCVTIRVCPKLSQYSKSTRNNYKSRTWGNHDGVSYKIEKVEKMRHNEMIGKLKREKNKNLHLHLKKSHNNTKGKKLIKESSRKSGKETNDDLVVFNKHGDPCYKYSPNLVSDSNYLKNKLRVEVMYLENDDETYEISYDEIRDKYRFAIVSSDTASEVEHRNNNNSDNNNKVLEEGKMQGVEDNDVDDYNYDDDDDDDDDDDELKDCPLRPKDLYEIFRDDLEFHEISWNILGLVVADKTNYLHSLLCIIQRVFWRPKL